MRDQGIRPDYPYIEPEDFDTILAQAAPIPQLEKLPEKEYAARIEGALYGRIAGVALGKPLEMGMDAKQIRAYLESVHQYPLNDFVEPYSEKLDIRLREDCIPSTRGNVHYMQADDDIHYTILSLMLAEQKGLDFTGVDIGLSWLENLLPPCNAALIPTVTPAPPAASAVLP